MKRRRREERPYSIERTFLKTEKTLMSYIRAHFLQRNRQPDSGEHVERKKKRQAKNEMHALLISTWIRRNIENRQRKSRPVSTCIDICR